MATKTIITHFTNRNQFMTLLQNNPGLIIIKFGAEWCRPCQTIKPIVHAFFTSSPDNVICCDIDVDESFDLYAFLKSKRMINGIPTIFCYKKGNNNFSPDVSVSGIDPRELDLFFRQCNQYLDELRK